MVTMSPGSRVVVLRAALSTQAGFASILFSLLSLLSRSNTQPERRSNQQMTLAKGRIGA